MNIKQYKTTEPEVWAYFVKNWPIMTIDPTNTPMKVIEGIKKGSVTFKGKPVILK